MALLSGVALLATSLGAARRTDDVSHGVFTGTVTLATLRVPDVVLDPVVAEAPARELRRVQTILEYSTRFNLDGDLAALIYDIAVSERIDPELGFRVVQTESRFNPRAISSAGALGLAQLMPNTARIFVPDLTDEEMFDAELNLRIGFRFLHEMLERYSGDLSLALLAYNRGPSRLQELLARGIDPRNGYASAVLKGYLPNDGDGLQ
jgi:soluble lytic murein transglycosylase-like protein